MQRLRHGRARVPVMVRRSEGASRAALWDRPPALWELRSGARTRVCRCRSIGLDRQQGSEWDGAYRSPADRTHRRVGVDSGRTYRPHRADPGRRGHAWCLGRLAKMLKETLNGTRLADQGDDPHRLPTARAEEREDLHPRRAKQAYPWTWLSLERRATSPTDRLKANGMSLLRGAFGGARSDSAQGPA